jgi:fermentation-respiration switch protein FrsA (DUF1100 family)
MERLIAKIVIWYGTHRRGTNLRRTPATFSLQFTELSFPSTSSKEAQLHGWLIPAQQPKGIVLLCHGIDSAAHAMLPKAAMLTRHGYTCMLFDFRATGRSGGDYVTLGLHEAEDVLGAVAYIQGQSVLRGLPIMAIGESMGGSAVIRAAAVCDAIRAVISESTYATLADALWQRLKLLGPFARRVEGHCHQIGADKYDVQIRDVSPERDVAAISPRPLLIIHDNLDVLCPRSETDRLYMAANQPKERWDVPYAPHTFAFMVAPREYERRIVDFLDRAIETSRMVGANSTPEAITL